jgi:hypothetical protein
MEKRRKERQRQERQDMKAERRKQRMEERAERRQAATGEDPDLIGIVAGPQPPPALRMLDDVRPTKSADDDDDD